MDLISKNKKAQGMSTNTIILLILGLVVLVVLILGFTQGWNNLAPWISSNNVDAISKKCETSCAMQNNYNFCLDKQELKTGDETFEDVTCNYLAEKTNYGIDDCPEINCEIVYVDVPEGQTLESLCDNEEYSGQTIQSLIDSKLETVDCSAE